MARKNESNATEAVTFYSKYTKLRVVVIPRSKMIVDGRFMNTGGKTAEFDRGTYTTTDPEIIEFLRNDRSYGVDYFESEAALAETVQPETSASDDGEALEVTRPRTRPGQRAAVKAKATTAADIDGDEPVASAEGADSDESEE